MVLWKTKKWGNFSPSPHPTSAILGGLFAPSLQRTQGRIQLLTQDALDEVLCGEKIQARDWDSWLSRCPWSPSNSSILLFLLKNKEIIYLLIACINKHVWHGMRVEVRAQSVIPVVLFQLVWHGHQTQAVRLVLLYAEPSCYPWTQLSNRALPSTAALGSHLRTALFLVLLIALSGLPACPGLSSDVTG